VDPIVGRTPGEIRAQLIRHLPVVLQDPPPLLLALLSGFAAVYSRLEVYGAFLRNQTFISLAEGSWLDEHARERGLERLSGEDDETLRARVQVFEERVTPPAILARANSLLKTGEAELIEHPLAWFLTDVFLPTRSMYEGRRLFDGEPAFTVVVPPQTPVGPPGMWTSQAIPAASLSAGAGSNQNQLSDPESVAASHEWDSSYLRLRNGLGTIETRQIAETRRTWLLPVTPPALLNVAEGDTFRIITAGSFKEHGSATGGNDEYLDDAIAGLTPGDFNLGHWIIIRPGRADEEVRAILGNTETRIQWRLLGVGPILSHPVQPGDKYMVVSADPTGMRGGICGPGSALGWIECQSPQPSPFTADSENGRDLILRPGELTKLGPVSVVDTFETVLFIVATPLVTAPSLGEGYELANTPDGFVAPVLHPYLVDQTAPGPSGVSVISWLTGSGPAPDEVYGHIYTEVNRIKPAGVRPAVLIAPDA
jgi:hypothetical protein